jgi:hypothetical protein
MKCAAVFVATGCLCADWAWEAGLWLPAVLIIGVVVVWLLRDPEGMR